MNFHEFSGRTLYYSYIRSKLADLIPIILIFLLGFPKKNIEEITKDIFLEPLDQKPFSETFCKGIATKNFRFFMFCFDKDILEKIMRHQ